ncbi:hypothetical protein MBLNU230_g6204t1 [Neophaeotheca triangularis]
MAPSTSSLPPQANTLYNKCLSQTKTHPDGLSKNFFQDDLLEIGSLPNVEALLPLTQALCSANLFRSLRIPGGMFWRIRPRDVAGKLTSIAQEDYVIYVQIEDAGQKGLWSRSIKAKVGMSQVLVGKSLTRLENKGLIKAVKNVKSPAQKVYMLSHFQPGEELTGGVFFDGSEIDEALVNELSNLIVFFVRSKSWDLRSRDGGGGKGRLGAGGKKRRALAPPSDDEEMEDGEDGEGEGEEEARGSRALKKQRKLAAAADMEDYVSTSFSQRRSQAEHAYPAFTHHYPQPEAILAFIQDSGALRGGKASALNVTAIERLVDVLVMDEKLERIGEGYRTVKGVYEMSEDKFVHGDDGPGTGLTEAPCGRCPVFDVCGDGGPVNARSCPYWQEWLTREA